MRHKSLRLLEDIRDAATFILACVKDKTEQDYESDRLLRQAIERNLEIIGEAIGRLLRIDSATAERLSDHRQIIAFRNLLIHGYDVVDYAKVWRVIGDDLPRLVHEATLLLGEDSESA